MTARHRRLPAPALALALIGLLSACAASPVSHYYLLEADTANASASPSPGQADTPSLGVGPLSIPPYLQRDHLVYHLADSRLQVAAYHQWAEPLEDGMTRVLLLHLTRGLGTHNLRRFPWHPERAPDLAVSVDILALELRSTGATLTADWQVYRPNTEAAGAGHVSTVHAGLPAGTSPPEALPAVYAELLRRLADVILTTLRADAESTAD
ncbi:MAG: membrane integrity-associated transporter subunit PqiC [Halioglobus sp.]|nr:membrane integrity-associated transporter subunit PqiC [Halioglobus sp.]